MEINELEIINAVKDAINNSLISSGRPRDGYFENAVAAAIVAALKEYERQRAQETT